MAPPTTEGLQSVIRCDGLVMITKDWRIFGPHHRICFSLRTPNILGVSASEFKGIRLLKNRRAVQFVLRGSFTNVRGNNMVYSILVTSTDPISWIKQEDVQKAYLEGIKYALDGLQPGSKTLRDLVSKYPAQAVEEITGDATVQPEDLVIFGRRLIEKMQMSFLETGKEKLKNSEGQLDEQTMDQLLRTKGLDYECHLLIYELGQSLEWERMKELLRQYKPSHAEEIVIHIARDYWQEGKCVLWNLGKLLDKNNLIGGKSVVYFNMMTKGHASVEFNKENGQQDIHCAHLKFYTDAYKEMHRSTGDDLIRWKKPFVVTALTEIKEDPLVVNKLNTLNEWLVSVEDGRKLLRGAKHNTARCEAIISASRENLKKDGKELKGAAVWNRLLDFFLISVERRRQREKHWLNVFDYQEMLQQVNTTIWYAEQTLARIAQETLRRRLNKETLTSIPDIRELQLAAACECIISFFIYGKLNYFPYKKQGERFSNDLIKKLELVPTSFKGLEEGESPFQGIVMCAPVLTRENGRLKYKGPLYVQPTVWETLKKETSTEKIKELHDFLVEVNKLRNANWEDENLDFLRVCEIIWESMTNEASQDVFNNNHGTNRNPAALTSYIKSRRMDLTCDTVQCFFERMFKNPEDFTQRGVAHYLRDLVAQLNDPTPRVFLKFRKQLVQYVDEQLFRSQSLALLYQVNDDDCRFSLVLPFISTALDNFKRSSFDSYYNNDNLLKLKQKHLLDLYEFAYKRQGYGKLNSRKTLEEGLIAANTKSRIYVQKNGDIPPNEMANLESLFDWVTRVDWLARIRN